MKKPALTLLASVVLFAAAFALWLALNGSDRSGRAGTPRAPAPVPAEAAVESPLASPEVELAAADAPASPTELAPSAASVEQGRTAAPAGAGRRIRGRVLVPAGAPADDSLRVVALKEALAPRKVYGAGGVLAELADGKRESALGTAPVAADGTFTLALATEGEAWLAVDGRFLYSLQVQRAPAGEAALELAAELGGCLAGKLRLPEGVPAAALEKTDVELGPDGEDFSMSALGSLPLFPRHAQPDGGGRFELRALPGGVPHGLEVRPEAAADQKVGKLEFEPGRVRELEVVLLRGAQLRGSVRDERGTPVEGAQVIAAESAIWGFPGEELAETKSDSAGAFVLENVAPGKCLLLAKKDGALESDHQKLDLRDEEQRERLELVLARGAIVAGSVRKADGSAAAGAEIAVSFDPEALVGMGAFNAARGGSGKAKSDGDGRFEVAGLGKGPFEVRATLEREAADGGKEKWLAKAVHVKPDTRDLELTLAAPSVVTGRVRDVAGAPVTEFRVRATLDSAAFFVSGTMHEVPCADPEGDFVLRDLEAGKWKVEAVAEGFGPMVPLELTLPRSDDAVLECVLAPAASIAGRVLEPDGSPASGARVTLHVDAAQRIQRMRGDVKAPEALSIEDGTFVLGNLGGGTTTIVAERAGLAPSEPAAVETRPGERSAGVVLKLRKGAVVTGEVYGADGKPAGGVRIIAQEGGALNTNMKGADGEGRFRFEGLTPGSWTISALMEASDLDLEGDQSEVTASFMENLRFTMVQLEDGEEEHVVLGAPPKDPVRVRGQVRHGKEGLSGGLVSFIAEGSKGLEALKMTAVGGDGRYEVELPAPGRYFISVQVNASGAAFQQETVEFRETIPEVEEHVLDFTLPLGGVRGQVRGADRQPLAGTRVTLVTEGGVESGSLLGSHYAEATTDADGRYAFQYLRPGDYCVAAGGAFFAGAFGGESKAGRLIRSGLKIDEGKTLEGIDFELEAPGRIRGRVLDAMGAPVKDASVFVRDAGGHLLDRLSMTTTAADGSFTYEGVAEGEYLVSARGKGLASAESAPLRVPKAGSASIDLVVQAGTKLVIEILDDDGNPLQARVTVTDPRGREMQGMLGFSEMASGFNEGFDSSKQSVGPLPPGPYTVTAVTSDGKKTSKPVTLDGQPERRLKLRLR